MTVYDLVNSVSETKKYQEDLTEYAPWIVNKSMSFHYDTILDAQNMNQYSDIEKKWQYDYYFHKLKKKKRYGNKWPKPEKDEDIELIMTCYKYNRDRAKEVLELFSIDDLEYLKQKQEKGGVKNVRNRK